MVFLDLKAKRKTVEKPIPHQTSPLKGEEHTQKQIMGKVTGFMEFQRLSEAAEAPKSRLHHYREFVITLKDDEAKVQGARCMDCGIPFCQTGCPVNNIIPDWNDLVYRGSITGTAGQAQTSD